MILNEINEVEQPNNHCYTPTKFSTEKQLIKYKRNQTKKKKQQKIVHNEEHQV